MSFALGCGSGSPRSLGRHNGLRGGPAGGLGKFASQLGNFVLNRILLGLQRFDCQFQNSILIHVVPVTFPLGWGMPPI